MKKNVKILPPFKKSAFALISVFPLLVLPAAQAVEFNFAEDEVTGSVDSTVSYGQLWRVQGQAKNNDGINDNDGNRNFDTGLVSEVFKITTDAEAKYKNYGAFVRGTAFYDTQLMDKRNDYYDNNNPAQPSQNYPKDSSYTYDTRHTAGRNAEILDAYVYGNWDVAEKPVTARLGKQVFNWGEGLFYRGGVNTTNPIDAAKFRLPGSELKEVLIPVEALNLSVGLTDNLSMETFYQFNWKETAIDPVGTYFSETDLFASGGNTAYRDFSGTPLTAPQPLLGGSSLLQFYERAGAGGYGPGVLGLLQGVGLYQQGVNFSDGGVVRVAEIDSDINAKNDGQFGTSFKYIAEELNSTEFGAYFVNYHAKEPVIAADLNGYTGVDLGAVSGVLGATAAGGLATIDMLGAVRGKREYVEDIRMMGLSFNTTLDETSVFGEVAYRPNNPIGVAPTNDLIGDLILQGAQLADNSGSRGPNSGTALLGGERIARNGTIHDYTRVETFNASLGAIQNFGTALSFDSLFGVAELASEHYRGDSLQYTAFDGSNRYYAGRSNSAYLSGYDRSSQINRNAYGYTLLLNGTWNDVYAGVNLSPYAVYKSDFEGNSSLTGNFIEGRQAYTLGLRASYLSSLEAELAYTEYYGAGQDNVARDRDNIGMNVKYSF